MRLMIVGNLEGHISAAGKIAIQKGANVVHTDDTEQALAALRAGKGADLVMIDIKQKIGTFIEQLKIERISVPVIACGIETDAATAVKAIKAGAKEYLPLPPDAELIAAVLEAVTEEDNTLIANDPTMKAVLKMADQIAPSTATVLITGASGTGKEVISKYIHKKSKRADKPFISINCAAIPENLMESEFFGHEKGAFTGAIARRIGKFEEANGGTLLLDEISEMDPSLQAKLLRAIQERVIDRIGGTQPINVDIRILATSNRDLEKEIKLGNFREDLYFRLNVINIQLPSLSERPNDIIPIADLFIQKYSEQNDMPVKSLSKESIVRLMSHHWSGNVRELENTMHRAVLLSQENEIEEGSIILTGERPQTESTIPETQGTIDATASTSSVAPNEAEDDNSSINAFVGQTVAHVEQDLILSTLDHCLGNRTHAANILGISIRTLRNKLKQYNEKNVALAK